MLYKSFKQIYLTVHFLKLVIQLILLVISTVNN